MQTHRDHDAPDNEALKKLRAEFYPPLDEKAAKVKALEARAAEMVERGESQITAGAPGERELFRRRIGRLTVRRLPADPFCTRISLGGVPGDDGTNYLVYRGDGAEVRRLLREAIDSMEELP